MNGHEETNGTHDGIVKRSIYVDYNATTPLAPSVKQQITETLDLWGNPSSSHKRGCDAKSSIETARSHLQRMLNGNSESTLIFM